MDNDLIQFVLIFLLISMILNFVLTIRIAAIVRETPEPQSLPLTLPLEEPLPEFSATRLSNGSLLSSKILDGSASVLVFLSAGCSDCRKRIPQLEMLMPAMQQAGIKLFLIGMEKEIKVRQFLGESALLEHVILLDKETRGQLNPRNASPFYIFADDRQVTKASNFIGDENWLIFVDQMQACQLDTQQASQYVG